MCGNGRIAIHLAKYGYEIVGLDISATFIEDSRRRARNYGVNKYVKFYVGDARRVDEILEKESPFDAVLNVWTSIGYYDEQTDKDFFRRLTKFVRRKKLFVLADCGTRDRTLSR